MSLRINNNIASVNGHRNLLKNTEMVSKSLERLSSGLKINRAADGAAGLIISEQMRAQLGGLNQAISNSEQAVTMVQTAEGALDEVSNLLNKARSLAIHAANEGVNDTNQLVADQGELDNIIDSINRIADTTQFGTKKLLDGSLGTGVSNNSAVASVKLGGDYASLVSAGSASKGYHTLSVTQVATQASKVILLTGADIFTVGGISGAASTDKVQDTFTMSINGVKLTISSGTTRDQMVQQFNAVGKSVGFTAALTGLNSGSLVLTAENYGRSFDFDVQYVSGASGASLVNNGTETAGVDAKATLYLYNGNNTGVGDNGTATTGAAQTMTFSATGSDSTGLRMTSGSGSVIVLSTNVASGVIAGAVNATTSGATFQTGANAGQTATVELASVGANQLGVGGSGTYTTLNALKGSSLIGGAANEALKVIDKAIDDVTTIRGGLGAFQANTLETNISSLRVTVENLTAAESTIRDVDFAAESAKFTKYNILAQSATAMLAQANQLPQGVLQLLGG